MRYPHFLRQATGGVWPSTVVCLDCTTTADNDKVHGNYSRSRLTLWHTVLLRLTVGSYHSSDSIAGADWTSFWRYLERIKSATSEVWIFAYRASDQWAILHGWERAENGALDMCVIEDPPTILKWRSDDGQRKFVLVDTANYGSNPNVKCTPGSFTAKWVADWFTEYHSLCRRYLLGSLKPTIGSQAIHGYKCSYYPGGIHCHVNAAGERIEQAAYYGGRCEPHRIGAVSNGVWHLDYRSMYPFVCRDTMLPVRLRETGTLSGVSELQSIKLRRLLIARVAIETDEEAYPVQCVHDVIYPIGRFWTTLCGPELDDALAAGRVKDAKEYAAYDGSPALSAYSRAIYGMRCDAELSTVHGISAMAKLACVTLAGKFGQRSYRWTDTDYWHDYRYYGQWEETDNEDRRVRYRSIAGKVQRDDDTGLADDSNLAIAAWITSAGRIVLLNAIRVAGWLNTYYCDTDALMINHTGYVRLRKAGYVSDGEWGKLQVKSGFVPVEIFGIKHYREGNKTVCAGLPQGRVEDIGDGLHYRCRISPTEEIVKGHRPVAASTIRTYQRDVRYHHRSVNDDGTTLPIRLKEW